MPYRSDGKILAWWSGGITSAVATKLAIEQYGDAVQIYFFETGNHHPDLQRFMADCEAWYGVTISALQNRKYRTARMVMVKDKYVNGPDGARCTLKMKKEMRWYIERVVNYRAQVFGFELDVKQRQRAERFFLEYPEAHAQFPLIEWGLTKTDCFQIIANAGIKLPEMYRLGYHNNNCVGCVKGGMGYWNKIRRDFPTVFEGQKRVERIVGATAIKGLALEDLDPERGRHDPPLVGECGIYCPTEYEQMMLWRND